MLSLKLGVYYDNKVSLEEIKKVVVALEGSV